MLGLNSKDRKSIRDKANISNPKVNRVCAPLTAISEDCVEITLVPSIPYISLGVYHTGEFDTMFGWDLVQPQVEKRPWIMTNLSTLKPLIKGTSILKT